VLVTLGRHGAFAVEEPKVPGASDLGCLKRVFVLGFHAMTISILVVIWTIEDSDAEIERIGPGKFLPLLKPSSRSYLQIGKYALP
jgi:hypothetical protein